MFERKPYITDYTEYIDLFKESEKLLLNNKKNEYNNIDDSLSDTTNNDNNSTKVVIETYDGDDIPWVM